jgi:microsomal dipeptidase-like Zn-dependent dipeptidase
MGAVGMLIDVSHCGDRTTLDAIEVAKGSVAITHSNCRAPNDHPRLKTDKAICKLASKGGVIGASIDFDVYAINWRGIQIGTATPKAASLTWPTAMRPPAAVLK